MELLTYSNKYDDILIDYINEKTLKRYDNQGWYRVLSWMGIYHSDFYVAEIEHNIVGFILIRKKMSSKWQRSLWIYDVMILPEYRGRGYANIMLKLALDKCKQRPVRLYVSKENEVAINLYKRNGFITECETENDLIMRYDKV